MANKRHNKFGSALSTLAAATILVAASAGSTTALAQTTTLQPPSSGLKNTNRNNLAAPAGQLASPAAAPLAAPLGQATAAPLTVTPTVRPGTVSSVAKSYVLKAHVVPGAALNAQQKLATAMAALNELAKQAKDQQDKETEEQIAQLQRTLSIGNSATLSLLSPKSAIGNSVLSVSMADRVDFERNQVSFNAESLKKYGNLIGWPAAYCSFTAPEAGYYMVAYTVENLPNVGGTTTVTASILPPGITAGAQKNEAKATLNKGQSVVAVVKAYGKGESAIAMITSDNIFAFNACEISRIK